MAAFDRVESGIPDLDAALDNIRLGDNVVWQLSRLEDFVHFSGPFVRQAIADGRDLVYIRFASHPALVQPQPGLKIFKLDPNRGFEPFTVEVRRIITQEGRDAFYVFDCLSELRTAWNSDLMMGNFFRVTCPYLFELDTVAYFPLLRGQHSFAAVAKIRDTTQLLLDVLNDEDELFIHPLKVWERYSQMMFLPHRFNPATRSVTALSDGVEMSRFFDRMEAETRATGDRYIDSWDRFFLQAKHRHERGELEPRECARMCNMMMTRDTRMRTMVKRYFTPEDYFAVRNRMVGTGMIGGKACGMLLARKIIETELPEAAPHIEAHDSFYVGSDVFYTYIVYNNLWKLRISQQAGEGFIDAAPALQKGIMEGAFPEDLRNNFTRILDYYGQTPIIVRSSSFLEDGFGNAFAGKYESVFCPNIGEFEDRLRDFENAVRRVYASSLDKSALEYRIRNGLENHEEQMSLLVQRVSGSHYPNGSFMPTAAGVGYSHSAYCWMDGMDPDAGMLRLVMGLGTKAVDRTGRDYPRIVSLDRPLATTAKSIAEKHRYSQRYVNYIDVMKRSFAEMPCDQMAEAMPPYARNAVMEHDREAERRLRERGSYQPVVFASCQGLVENQSFVTLMRGILQTIARVYEYPVDIEYTVNMGKDGDFTVSLLQCRPLQAPGGQQTVDVPDLAPGTTLFHVKNACMGNSRAVPIDEVIVVDPERYYRCPYAKKSIIATLVERANAEAGEAGRRCLLFAPGRLGTSSPELGVPVSFAAICNLEGIIEVGYSAAGYAPELSYGSHMFQDLVEANIYYGALFEDARRACYRPDFLEALDARSSERIPFRDSSDPDVQGIVRTFSTQGTGLTLWHDAVGNETVCGVK